MPTREDEAGFWPAATAACEAVLAADTPEWSLVFEMARAVRGHPHAGRYKPITVAQRVYRTCAGVRENFAEEDFVTEFMACWKKVRVLPGTNPLESALRFSEERRLSLRSEHQGEVTEGYRRFVSLAGWLCVVLGSDRIKLPCREVAKVLGVRPNTVSCYRQQAVEHGYLVETHAHSYKPGAKGEATEFRFPTNWWDCLKERMPKKAG